MTGDPLPLFGDALAGETQAQRAARRAERERILKRARRTVVVTLAVLLGIGFVAGAAVATIVDALTDPHVPTQCERSEPNPGTWVAT